jgi:hypothetical protein
MVCDLCVKDGRRTRAIVKLIYEALPKASASGKPHPILLTELFIGWAKLKADLAERDGDAKTMNRMEGLVTKAREMLAAWRDADAVDQSEVAARTGRYNG